MWSYYSIRGMEMKKRITDWKNETRIVEFIKHKDIIYCSNCFYDECYGCISPEHCECKHEGIY